MSLWPVPMLIFFKEKSITVKTSLFLCLIIFHPPINPTLFIPTPCFYPLFFSHSLSGRAACEGPVQHNSAPAEASGSSGYNSEWLSISKEEDLCARVTLWGRRHPRAAHHLWPAQLTLLSNGLWLSLHGSRWTWVLVLAKGELSSSSSSSSLVGRKDGN